MGLDSLTAKSEGQTIFSAHPNALRNALMQVLYGRNSSGVVADIVGSLGSSTYRWLDAYIKNLYLGDTASGLSIRESSAGKMGFYIAGVLKSVLDSDGFDGAYMKALSIPNTALLDKILLKQSTASETFNLPSGTKFAIIELMGGGGGGGGGGNNGAGGASGAGGSSGEWFHVPVNLTGLSSVVTIIGAAGGGGAPNVDGTDGGLSSITINGVTYTAQGGKRGLKGVGGGPGTAGAIVAMTTKVPGLYCPAGNGNVSGGLGFTGDSTVAFAGGAGGTAFTGGGGGGGGASMFGLGGPGGAGGIGAGGTGGTGGTGFGAGGGGGGGSGTAGTGGAGGNASAGVINIYYY